MLDEHQPESTDSTTSPDPPARGRHLHGGAPFVDRAWLVITAFVVAICNWAFSGDRLIFHLLPDEPGALAMARWLSGRNRWNMFDHSTWQPALSVLITPVYWLTTDPEVIVRWSLTINALLMGVAAAVTVVLVQRLSGLPTRTAALVAIVIGTTPGALSGAGYVWAEPLVVLAFVTAVLCAIRVADGAGARWAHGAAIVAGLGYFAHGRLLPFVFTTTACVVATLLWQRRTRVAATTIVSAFVTFGVVRAATTLVHSNVWDETGEVNTSGSVFRRLEQPGEVLDHLVGQLWYQLVATLGVGAIGIVVVLGAIAFGDRPGVADRRAAVVITFLTAPQLVVSAAFLAGRPRADQLVYGRYNDAVMWPALVVGLCWLIRLVQRGWTRRRALEFGMAVAAMAAVGVVVDVRHSDVLDTDIGLRSMVAGLLPFVGRTDAVPVARITAIAVSALVVAIGVVSVARRRPALVGPGAVAVAAALLLVGAVRTHDGEARLLNGWNRLEVVRDIDEIVPADSPLAVKTVPNRDDPALSWERQRHRYQVFQLFLPHRTFLRDRGVDDAVGPYVFAPRDDAELLAAGAMVLWEDPTADLDLYLEPDRPIVDDS